MNIKDVKKRTKYFSDVRIPVKAAGKDFKFKVICIDVFRHYFDTAQKDCLVYTERTKRIPKY